MNNLLSEFTHLSNQCKCGREHFEITMEKVIVNKGALKEAASFIKDKSFNRIVIVVDKNTHDVAGQTFTDLFNSSEVEVDVCMIKEDEQNDVVANEESIVQLLLAVSKSTDVLVAVGAGTIHDITRFVSSKMDKPFISIPTAASVDGFNSMGAPLVIRGVKMTYQTQAPIAVFADVDILLRAPRKMTAAGFGDMLGKSTSLADWRFGHLIGNEPFCPLAYRLTEEALQACITNVEKIAAGEEEGIKVLTESLIQSGIAMLLIGHSYPASGAEHHLSHYWEMDFIRNKKAQVLHGAKVSISCWLISDFYRSEVTDAINQLERSTLENELINKVLEHKEDVLEIIKGIPEAVNLKEMIAIVGGETEPSQLGIDQDLLQKSFREAHLIRERFTFLRFYNQYIGNATNR
ncbi:sn-glycerol-1-phosphate dehydrogenase [Halalkalibacter akibai]|uniref:Glycerol-1-phosphate dehydrogenase n=1 Tax=Halalkalibacter akibai (strain ATCC 43226 / DSM 21942 / CIP 109018 / JCM 9157 / 1139) TaxID=1236973 RepID=W4QQP6_HALA3|nr:sn-glycerol-1-phosphate dehydrogenase [Halalkalibacter akibai]GAE33958.1 glycerol-1-phosphate dehydrogenase [Halalkalibacter akibai JCM 9157]